MDFQQFFRQAIFITDNYLAHAAKALGTGLSFSLVTGTRSG